MKKNLILIALLSFSIISCSDWLDVTPPDTVEESQLFSTGEGYRNALNGVYKNLSTNSMYAQELTWGFLDVLALYYDPYRLDYKGYYSKYVCKYKYKNADVKGALDAIWQKAYKSIANCNNLLQNIETENGLLFAGGKLEKNMIEGEALALRAFIHFDLLRLFAPAPVNDDGNNYIPYCDTYPSIIKERETVNSCLDKIKRDLLRAKELVGSFDTIPGHIDWLATGIRIEAKNGQITPEMPDDLFYAYRGFRMNYYAIKAILSRVYSYAGELENAYKEADAVCNAKGSQGNLLFDFTSMSATPKLYDGVIFALSNTKIVENFEQYYTGTKKSLYISKDIFNGEEHDVRFGFLVQEGSGYWAQYVSMKYMKMKEETFKNKVNESLIPMIRRSELCYIMGEYLYSVGKTQEAIDKLKEVRIARSVPDDLPQPVTNEGDYVRELLRDARREFIGEGQLFYMHKKFNVKTSPWDMPDESAFVLPIPDSENINF